MKRLRNYIGICIVLLTLTWMPMGCATHGQYALEGKQIREAFLVHIPTSDMGDVPVYIPAELPDFVTGQFYQSYPLSKELCGVIFPHEGVIYTFLADCIKPIIYALAVKQEDEEYRYWIYDEVGMPHSVGEEAMKELIRRLIPPADELTVLREGGWR